MVEITAAAREQIIAAGKRMDSRGWVPATAGNISVRLGADALAITTSGNHKGFLTGDHVMAVDLEGRALTQGKPSAETLLHCQAYRLFPQVGAVLHGHSVAGTVLTMATTENAIWFEGYEVLKAFEGQSTHQARLPLPVVDNDQDIPRLANVMESQLSSAKLGYYIRGHGVYVWGPDMPTALARLEGIEFLLACELERRKLAR